MTMMTLSCHIQESVNPIQRILVLLLVLGTIYHWLLAVID